MYSTRRLQWIIDCVTRNPCLGDYASEEINFCEVIIVYEDGGEDCFFMAPAAVQGFLASLLGPDGRTAWPHALPRRVESVMRVDYARLGTPHGTISMPDAGTRIYDPEPGGPTDSILAVEREEGADWHPRAGSRWDTGAGDRPSPGRGSGRPSTRAPRPMDVSLAVESGIVDLIGDFIGKSQSMAPVAMREVVIVFEDGGRENYRIRTADLMDFLINLFADTVFFRESAAPGVYQIIVWTHTFEEAKYGRCIKVGEPLYLYYNPARMPAEEREWLDAREKEG